jgi:phosphatidylserine/phosphatidylglycerophosphate/cardiolipin synthase-like enzyme
MRLIAGRGHYEAVIPALRSARTSVWIATANLKELLVEDPRATARSRSRFHSVLEVFSALAQQKVELRILHAAPPSGPFRRSFDRRARLYKGGLELRQCPRVHLKTVIVDGRLCYLGSANWTGAGLGAKGEGRRNFEMGIVTDDTAMLDMAQARFDRIWRGGECSACKLKGECPQPLIKISDVVKRRASRSRAARPSPSSSVPSS